jgi:hypothetical protein
MSAATAAMQRAALDEMARACGTLSATVYVDLSKFYDSVPLDILIARATAAGYPARVLHLALVLHACPRAVRIAGCVSTMRAKLAARGFELDESSWLNPVEAIWSVSPGEYDRRPPDLDHHEFLLLARRPMAG